MSQKMNWLLLLNYFLGYSLLHLNLNDMEILSPHDFDWLWKQRKIFVLHLLMCLILSTTVCFMRLISFSCLLCFQWQRLKCLQKWKKLTFLQTEPADDPPFVRLKQLQYLFFLIPLHHEDHAQAQVEGRSHLLSRHACRGNNGLYDALRE